MATDFIGTDDGPIGGTDKETRQGDERRTGKKKEGSVSRLCRGCVGFKYVAWAVDKSDTIDGGGPRDSCRG